QEASFTSKELAALEKKLSLAEMKIAALEKSHCYGQRRIPDRS
ncbi:hypothetical protein BDE36_0001, partial [Arcticibacter tournemirensis]